MTNFAYLYDDPLIDISYLPINWELPVDKVYQDLGGRQQWKQMLLDCQTQKPDYLIIRRPDELGDSLEEINQALTQLEKLGIKIITIEQFDGFSQFAHTDYPDLRANLVQILNQIHTNQRSQKLRQGHAKNRLKALPPPGKAPYGYRRGQDRYIIDRSTAPVVKDFVERFLLFGSLRGAVRYLEQKYGKKISVSTGRRWLTSSVYRGNLTYKDGGVISHTHIPIIAQEEAAQIDRLLRRNSRIPPKSASARRSLAGLVVCQPCQSSMTIKRVTTHNKQREYLYLRPVNCPRQPQCRGIPYQEVLDLTIERIGKDLPPAVAKIDVPMMENIKENIESEIKQKQDILTQIPLLKNQGILDQQTADLRCYKLQVEIAQLQGKMAQLPPANLPTIAQAVSLRQFWLDLSESERRVYFREFIRQIEIIRLDDQQWRLKLVLFLNHQG